MHRRDVRRIAIVLTGKLCTYIYWTEIVIYPHMNLFIKQENKRALNIMSISIFLVDGINQMPIIQKSLCKIQGA